MGMCGPGLPSSDSADLANDAKTFQSFPQFSAKTATLYTQLALQTTFKAITQVLLEVELDLILFYHLGKYANFLWIISSI